MAADSMVTPAGRIRVGQRISYVTFFDTIRTGVVLALGEEHVNGRPGFDMMRDGFTGDDGLVWGYGYQVKEIHHDPKDGRATTAGGAR